MSHTSDEKLFYQIALTKVPGVGDIVGKNLLAVIGEPEAIFKSTKASLSAIKGLSQKVINGILNPEILKEAEDELNFVKNNNLQTYFITEEEYPQRMIDCVDSPLLLYYKGTVDFNKQKVISIVGTRNSTRYGSDFCDNFLKELAVQYPDLLVISGLAYGIDIMAHRGALANGLSTIGVLAHGLDRIYPTVHRQTAMEMVKHGGLLTEFPSKTEPDRFNFVRRNRIVAGMADAVLVIESNIKGGSLITAEIASSYCKDVFALPGRVNDTRSEGCNKLIENNKAGILISAEQFIRQMNWGQESGKNGKVPKQQQLFFDLSPEETAIIDKLSQEGAMHIDQLAKKTEISAFDLFSILMNLEMRGAVSSLAGSFYELA